MSPEAKKKVGIFCAGLVTVIILGVWAVHSFGLFSSAFDSTQKQGVAVFSFLDENVQRAYDAFQNEAPKLAIAPATSTTEMTASTTIATTTPNEIQDNEFLTGQAATNNL